MDIVVPAYFDPDSTDWLRLSAVPAAVPVWVLDPASGPGDYSTTILANAQRAQAAGQKVLAYVNTAISTRSTALCTADVDTYYAWYAPDGIFFDWTSTNPGDAAYLLTLYNYVKAISPSALVYINPGTMCPESYMAACDVACIFENNWGVYRDAYPDNPAWVSSYDPSRFWHLVYACPDTTSLAAAKALAVTRHAGHFYGTTLDMPNPWLTLPAPTYWSFEVGSGSTRTIPSSAVLCSEASIAFVLPVDGEPAISGGFYAGVVTGWLPGPDYMPSALSMDIVDVTRPGWSNGWNSLYMSDDHTSFWGVITLPADAEDGDQVALEMRMYAADGFTVRADTGWYPDWVLTLTVDLHVRLIRASLVTSQPTSRTIPTSVRFAATRHIPAAIVLRGSGRVVPSRVWLSTLRNDHRCSPHVVVGGGRQRLEISRERANTDPSDPVSALGPLRGSVWYRIMNVNTGALNFSYAEPGARIGLVLWRRRNRCHDLEELTSVDARRVGGTASLSMSLDRRDDLLLQVGEVTHAIPSAASFTHRFSRVVASHAVMGT